MIMTTKPMKNDPKSNRVPEVVLELELFVPLLAVLLGGVSSSSSELRLFSDDVPMLDTIR